MLEGVGATLGSAVIGVRPHLAPGIDNGLRKKSARHRCIVCLDAEVQSALESFRDSILAGIGVNCIPFVQ
jgi:hypothetical protein